jgi:hypothetical protein
MARITLDGGVKVRTFTPPPRGFDPITSSPADLLKHGFPARPDHPRQLERYRRVLGGVMKDRFRYIEPTFRTNPNRRHGPPASRNFIGPVRVRPQVTGTGNEFNPIWSGGLVFPPTGQSFRWITGEWTIPNVSAPVADNQTYYCAIWVGIDGDISVASQDCCQAGINLDVTQDGDNITRHCTAWCEWYPGPEAEINFPVTFGDTVVVTICTSGKGATEATIFFANITANHGTSLILPAGLFPDGSQISLVGDSAQWVVERPQIGDSGNYALLANYAEVFFSGCQAVSYSADGTSSEVVDGGTEIHIDMLPDGAPDPAGLLSRGVLVADEVVQCVFIAPGTGQL